MPVLQLRDEITEETGARLAGKIGKVPPAEPITLAINSPGGSVRGGDQIVAALKRHKGRVTAQVDALAASAASFVAMAADEVVMAPGSHLMIHCPSAIEVTGPRDRLLQIADHLATIEETYAAAYSTRAKVPAAKALEWMKAETWFEAEMAVSAGLADRIDYTLPEAEYVSPAVLSIGYKHIPQAVARLAKRPATPVRRAAQKVQLRRRCAMMVWIHKEEQRQARHEAFRRQVAAMRLEAAMQDERERQAARDRQDRNYFYNWFNVPHEQRR